MKRYLTLKRLQNAGVLHQPGSVVELSDDDARWCADLGVIDLQPIPEGAVMPPPAAPLAQPPTGLAATVRRCSGCGWR